MSSSKPIEAVMKALCAHLESVADPKIFTARGSLDPSPEPDAEVLLLEFQGEEYTFPISHEQLLKAHDNAEELERLKKEIYHWVVQVLSESALFAESAFREFQEKINKIKGNDAWQCAGELMNGERCETPVSQAWVSFCYRHGGPGSGVH